MGGKDGGVDTATRIDGLYRLPPEDFVAARDALVRELRADGLRDEAADVKSMRRPTVAAWALNQAARERADLVDAIGELGQELRDAQQLALSAGDASALRAATARRRQIVNELSSAAASVLTGAGRDARAQASALAAILDAAITNPAVAELLRDGRLVSEPEPVEAELLDLGDWVASPRASAASAKPARPRADTRRARHPTATQPAAAAEEGDALGRAVDAAQWDHERAVRAATDAAAALEAATARAATAASDLEEAQRRLDAAAKTVADTEARRDAARRAHDDAQAEVHRTAAGLDKARRALEKSAKR